MEFDAPDLAVTPSGQPHAEGVFAAGVGEGLLRLATAELTSAMPGGLGFARDLARAYCTALCRSSTLIAPPPAGAELAALAAAAPPLVGSEYLDGRALADWWQRLGAALCERAREAATTPQAWLHGAQPAWRQIGRVTFHLAENKRDPEHPFAFLATYAPRVSARGEPQHQPLSRALAEFSGARDRAGLLRLLEPIERAAEACPWVRKLVDEGAIYQALAWTPAEAHALLQDWPRLQDAGLVVRAPDWWNPAQPPRPRVEVTVGPRTGAGLNAEALLAFTATVGLDGAPLTPAEWEELQRQESGLVRLKGRWVELDAERLREALTHWKRIERDRNGMDFFAGMRLLAGVRLTEGDAAPPDEQPASQWTGVTASPALERRMSAVREPAAAANPPGLRATLRPYQSQGVQWLRLLSGLGLGACLADDMGLGKTIQVIALLLHRRQEAGSGPALLIVPASLVANWRQELERFAPELNVVVAHSGDSGFARAERAAVAADLTMTTYGLAARLEWLRARSWGLLVLDEAQAIKNPGARQTRAVKQLRAASRIALTGTPVENRLSDLWSLFDFLNPGLLGPPQAFGRWIKRLDHSGGSYAPLRRLVSPYLLRRLKTDRTVISDLPDKVEIEAFCALASRQVAMYGQTVRDLERVLGQAAGIQRQGAVLAALTRLKQICNHPAQASGLGAYDPRDSGKFQRLREICSELAERQDKVLVFTQFREITAPLAEFLAGVFGRPGVVLDGSVSLRQRRERVESFQREDGPPFFVLSLKAGGVGLNLTAAAHVIHFDRWWNPAVENQATDRAFRIGQKRSVMVHKFVCQGTVEDKIAALIRRKRQLADDLAGGSGEIPLTELPNEEILRLVRLDAAQPPE